MIWALLASRPPREGGGGDAPGAPRCPNTRVVGVAAPGPGGPPAGLQRGRRERTLGLGCLPDGLWLPAAESRPRPLRTQKLGPEGNEVQPCALVPQESLALEARVWKGWQSCGGVGAPEHIPAHSEAGNPASPAHFPLPPVPGLGVFKPFPFNN